MSLGRVEMWENAHACEWGLRKGQLSLGFRRHSSGEGHHCCSRVLRREKSERNLVIMVHAAKGQT